MSMRMGGERESRGREKPKERGRLAPDAGGTPALLSPRVLLAIIATLLVLIRSAPAGPPLDPAAWGSDHVDTEPPEYITGEECLFCHRTDVGPMLLKDPHNQTIHEIKLVRELLPTDPPLSLKPAIDEAGYILGYKKMIRFLKDSGKYNTLDLHGAAFRPPAKPEAGAASGAAFAASPESASAPSSANAPAPPHASASPAEAGWDGEKFGRDCVGCHATAVNKESRAYAALALDCYSCHGDVSLTHTSETQDIYLSRKREDPARVIASICGQCHLRGGKSRATGQPYPTQYIPGDNLFRDYEVDLSDAAIAKLAIPDRHIFENVRDMVVLDKTRVTCLTCHDLHRNTSKVHYGAPASPLCLTCHPADDPTRKKVFSYENHNAVCEY